MAAHRSAAEPTRAELRVGLADGAAEVVVEANASACAAAELARRVLGTPTPRYQHICEGDGCGTVCT